MACHGTTSSSSSSFPSNFLFQIQTPCEEDSRLFPSSNSLLPPNLQGMSPMPGKKRCASFDEMMNEEQLSDDDGDDDDRSPLGEKKKNRLNIEQVRTLERTFEQGNKLEPERKARLAKALGLRPRQVAVWFQNRRARSKIKQLEKDYDALKRQFEVTRTENGCLLDQNKKLQAEILALRGRETSDLEGSFSNRSENSSEISRTVPVALSSRPFLPSLGLLELENDSPEKTSFSSLLCNMGDDQSVFWPWRPWPLPDHHQSFH